jgi:hypothetical protein
MPMLEGYDGALGPAQGDSRRQGHVHDPVRAGEGRDVTATTSYLTKSRIDMGRSEGRK